MTSSCVILSVTCSLITFFSFFQLTNGLSSGSTIVVVSGSITVCGVVVAESTHSVVCYRGGQVIAIQPNVSFSSISGEESFFCGFLDGGYAFLCWDVINSADFDPRRVYNNRTVLVQDIAVGDNQICTTMNSIGNVIGTVTCWRGNELRRLTFSDRFESSSCGFGFCCGALMYSRRIQCWGRNSIDVYAWISFTVLS